MSLSNTLQKIDYFWEDYFKIYLIPFGNQIKSLDKLKFQQKTQSLVAFFCIFTIYFFYFI